MAAREIRAGKAFVELSLKNKMERDLQRAQRQLSNFAAGVAKVGAAFVGLGLAVLGPMALAVKTFINAGDELDKMSKRTGVSVESLSELAVAAGLAGAGLEDVEKSVLRMGDFMQDLARGTSSAALAAEELGLSFDALEDLDPEQRFLLIAEALSNIEDDSLRAALAQDVFGRSGRKLLPMFEDGAAGIEAMMEQARELGLTMTTEDAEAAATLTDKLFALSQIAKALAIQVGAALTPALIKMADPIIRIAAGVIKWVRDNRHLIVQLAKVATAVVAVGVTLLATAAVIKGVALSLGLLAAATKIVATGFGLLSVSIAVFKAVASAAALVVGAVVAILNPVTLVIGAVLALGVAAALLSDKFRAVVGNIIGSLALLPAAMGGVASGMLEIINSVVSRAGEAFGLIAALVSEGEIQAAIDLLWAYVQTEFQRGVATLLKVWADFKKWFTDIAFEAFYAVARIAVDAVTALQKTWNSLTAFFGRFWSNLKNAATETFNLVRLGAEKAANKMKGMLDVEFDVSAANEVADKAFEKRQQSAQAQARGEQEDIEDDRRRSEKEIASRQRAMQDRLREEQSRSEKRRGKEVDPGIREAERQLAEARAEYQRARAEAETKLEDARAERGESGDGGISDFYKRIREFLDDLAKRGTQGEQQEARGTFNATAIQGLQIGANYQKRTADAAERLARSNADILDELRDGGLAVR